MQYCSNISHNLSRSMAQHSPPSDYIDWLVSNNLPMAGVAPAARRVLGRPTITTIKCKLLT